ncbi:MFS transporter [Massilia rubra]|uniref:Multidrug effflux MFS transporter n=1 Tax=Massilia rubra TaxID=2607910 RepID=A0ABX0LFM5_9BURK|nr:MFS transporter [Massilia rubra]NHZ32825.1 multidrug effflux MFS transporter [Massilia rubra]
MSQQRRLAMPLATLTAVGMLASDLYLPALPSMQAELHATMAAGQGTMAVFMLALALSQFGWGWLADRYGDFGAIMAGTSLLAVGSVLCGLAPDMASLLAGRLIQGLGAGAATVAVPALIRRRFSEADSAGAMALVATVESTVPAIGPVLGAAIVLHLDWRVSFYLIAAVALGLLPLVSRIIGRGTAAGAAGMMPDAPAAWLNRGFVRHALSYAAMFGALLMVVASAPHLVTAWIGTSVSGFAVLQLCGVGAFMLAATLGARLAGRDGVGRAMLAGASLQALAAAMMLAQALADLRSLTALIAVWVVFCGGLGLRGPSLMARALSLAGGNPGKGAGVVMTAAFGVTALATMAVAPYLAGGLLPVALGVSALVSFSIVLVPGARRLARQQHPAGSS